MEWNASTWDNVYPLYPTVLLLLTSVTVSAEAKAVDSTSTAPKAESFEYNFMNPPKFRIERVSKRCHTGAPGPGTDNSCWTVLSPDHDPSYGATKRVHPNDQT
jgi:hypothetical protein